MATRDYSTVNPWNQTASLPRLSHPAPEMHGRIEKDNGYTKFQWCPSDFAKDVPSADELFYTVNRQNFRAEQFSKINKKPVLMSLGDSFTYGIGVRDAETWPSIVADKLDIVNWNMGSGGASNQDIYFIFQQMISNGYIPDVLCIMWSFKERSIVSRNIISTVVEETNQYHNALTEEDATAYSNSINNDIQKKTLVPDSSVRRDTANYDTDINDNITTQYTDMPAVKQSHVLEKSSVVISTYTDKDYIDFYIVRSAIINICKARKIKVRETFLDFELQKFAISHIVPTEGWRTSKFPMNPYLMQVDKARDMEHFGPKTLQSIADYYLKSLPLVVS